MERKEGNYVLTIFLLAFCSFLPSLCSKFVFDDLIHIAQNPLLYSPTPYAESFLTPLYPGELYRPVTVLSYIVTYKIFGLNPFPFHLTNLILHALVCILIFDFLKKIFPLKLALGSTVIYAVHPIHTEVVANISGRSEILAALGGLLFIILVIKKENWKLLDPGQLILSGTLLFSLLSKESGVVFIPLAWLVIFIKHRNFKNLITTLPAIFTALSIWLFLRTNALNTLSISLKTHEIDNPLVADPILIGGIKGALLLGKYLHLFFFPYPISADYSGKEISAITFIYGACVLAAISGLLVTIYLTNKQLRKIIFLSTFWFIISFLITSNILFPIGTIFAERLFYLPSLGVSLFAASLLYKKGGFQNWILFPAIAICLSLSLYYSTIWHNNESLWRYQSLVSVKSPKTWANLAVVEREEGRFDLAFEAINRSLQLHPNFAEGAFVKGTIMLAKGLKRGGEHWFYKAIEFNPAFAPAFLALGELYFHEGKINESKEKLEEALKFEADHPIAVKYLKKIDNYRKRNEQ